MNELINRVREKALLYAQENYSLESFPLSIVDFVIEYAINESHFPMDYTEAQVASRLSRCINALAMACIEVYARTGAEGETGHAENSISREYDGAWISSRLHDVLPNYVGIIA